MSISRRGVLFGLPLFLAGCAHTGIGEQRLNYAAKPEEKFPLPAMHLDKVKPELRLQEVTYDTSHPAGTVVVDTLTRRLYYVMGDGRAMRYGVGVGRQGLALKGDAYIGRKSEWPSWTPTANMMRRDPRNLKFMRRHAWWPQQPARRACALSLSQWQRHHVPPAWHQPAAIHRPRHVKRLHPHAEPRHHRSLQPRAGRIQGRGAAGLTERRIFPPLPRLKMPVSLG